MRRLARLNSERLAQLGGYVEYPLKAGTGAQNYIFTDGDHRFLGRISDERPPLPSQQMPHCAAPDKTRRPTVIQGTPKWADRLRANHRRNPGIGGQFQPASEDLLNRGIAKAGDGDCDGTIADYDRAIVLSAGEANAYNARGFAKRSIERITTVPLSSSTTPPNSTRTRGRLLPTRLRQALQG